MTARIAREAREITGVGDWLAWRRQDITASRVAALFDLHPYLSRAKLAALMRGGDGDAPNAAMRRGRILEPAVIAALSEDHPDWRMAKATTYHRLPEHRLGATPDYWLDDDGLVQVKTVSPQKWEEWQARPPVAYTLQTLTELIVTGRTRGLLAIMVCSPSYPVHLFDVPRHEGAEQRILAATAEWWRAFDAGETAGAQPSAELAAEVEDGSYRDLSSDNMLPLLLPEREQLKADLGRATARLKEIDYEITHRIGPARTAWLPGWTLKYPTIARKEYAVKAGSYRRLDVQRTEENADAQ